MGLASSVGLGIALSKPSLPVVVFDGDGSVLMNLGGLSTLARYRPSNLLHVVFDNESLLSVGGFPTATGTCTRLAEVAAAAGVPRTACATTIEEFVKEFSAAQDARRADHTRGKGGCHRAGGVCHRPRPARESFSVSTLPANSLGATGGADDTDRIVMTSSLTTLVADLAAGRITVVDLTHPLGPDTPVIGAAADVCGVARRVDRRDFEATTTRDPRGTGTPSAWASTPARTSTRPCTGSPDATCRTTPPTRFPPASSSAQRA